MSRNDDIYKQYLEGLSDSEIAEIVERSRDNAETDVAQTVETLIDEKPVEKSKKKGKNKTDIISLLSNIGRKKPSKKKSGEDDDASEDVPGSSTGTAASKPKKKLSEKEKTKRALIRLLKKIGAIAVVCIILFTLIIGVTIHHDNNMFPAVRDGDLAILFKPGSAYNGDIVIYEVDGENRMGRVVGIPGDTIDIGDNGTYLINGTVPYETIYYPTHPAPGSTVTYPYTVREGEVFIFNDMREDTKDSRIYGGITKTKGKVVLLIRRRGF